MRPNPPPVPPLSVTSSTSLHTHPQPCSTAIVLNCFFSLAVSDILQPPPPPPLPNLLQGLSAGQQGLLQLADAALQLVNLFVALSQLTTQLLWAEQQLTAPIRLLLQLGGQLVHLVVSEREKSGRERERDREREKGEWSFNEIRYQAPLATA